MATVRKIDAINNHIIRDCVFWAGLLGYMAGIMGFVGEGAGIGSQLRAVRFQTLGGTGRGELSGL